MYLLTVCFDWGPVALQHLLLVGGLFLLLRFYQTGSQLSLALGFLLWGLAMWDKALAIWMLGAFGVAGLCVFPRQIFTCDYVSASGHFGGGLSGLEPCH
jgi:hypothetical protein